MKNFQKLALGLMVGVLAIGFSAFTTVKRANSNFYVYTQTATDQLSIQTISNYVAATAACPSGSNVCGLTLPTAKPLGQTPVASEFSAESADLWTSQDSGTPADLSISMKN